MGAAREPKKSKVAFCRVFRYRRARTACADGRRSPKCPKTPKPHGALGGPKISKMSKSAKGSVSRPWRGSISKSSKFGEAQNPRGTPSDWPAGRARVTGGCEISGPQAARLLALSMLRPGGCARRSRKRPWGRSRGDRRSWYTRSVPGKERG